MPTPYRAYTVASADPPRSAEWRAEVYPDPDAPGRYRVWLLRFGGADAGSDLHGLAWEDACRRADSWAGRPPTPPDQALHAALDAYARQSVVVREFRREGEPDATWDPIGGVWVESDAALRRRLRGEDA